MRPLHVAFVFAIALSLAPQCEPSRPVLVVQDCDTEDLLIEHEGALAHRVAPGSDSTCVWVSRDIAYDLTSRCASQPSGIPVPIAVFDPAQECQ